MYTGQEESTSPLGDVVRVCANLSLFLVPSVVSLGSRFKRISSHNSRPYAPRRSINIVPIGSSNRRSSVRWSKPFGKLEVAWSTRSLF